LALKEFRMKLIRVVVCGIAMAALPFTSALADTMYTYTGNPFTSGSSGPPDAPFTTSDSVSGWFTIAAPLAANLAIGSITPTAYSFSNGVETFTNGEPFSLFTFVVGTDATGAINEWGIEVNGIEAQHEFLTISSPMQTTDLGTLPPPNDVSNELIGQNFNDPGTWVSDAPPPSTVTPEPSSLILLGSGALGLVGIMRQRISHSFSTR
jgi:PEP-CTERM motif